MKLGDMRRTLGRRNHLPILSYHLLACHRSEYGPCCGDEESSFSRLDCYRCFFFWRRSWPIIGFLSSR